jgi:transcription elongation factor GreA
MDIIKRMQSELADLEKELKLTLPRIIREAASLGDLSENAEYEAARQRQDWVKARIRHLNKRIEDLSLIDLKRVPRDRAAFGSTVTLEDLETGEEKDFSLVHPEEVDPAKGLISVGSPVGQSLIGKREGDEVTLRKPSGDRTYVISRLVTIHEQED